MFVVVSSTSTCGRRQGNAVRICTSCDVVVVIYVICWTSEYMAQTVWLVRHCIKHTYV